MDNQEMVLKFRYHILGALLLLLAIFSIFYLVPRFLSILAYFWPLYLSTILFIITVVLYAKTAPPLPARDAIIARHGEEILMNYVAGHNPDILRELEAHNNNSD